MKKRETDRKKRQRNNFGVQGKYGCSAGATVALLTGTEKVMVLGKIKEGDEVS